MFNLGRKGIVNFIEAIFVIIVIFTAFAVLFPGLSFKNKWSAALIILPARDVITSMDRLGVLYANSFDSNALQNFIDMTIPTNRTGLVSWSQTSGAIKSSITVACNCTSDQLSKLNYWMSGLQFNGRTVDLVFVPTTLENINPAADVLFIWGNLKLDSYLTNLRNYINSGGSIVEMNDFSSLSDTGLVQQQIFGLNYTGGVSVKDRAVADFFTRKPNNSTDIIYGPYKYFFHIPVALKTYESNYTFPVEKNMQQPVCSTIYHGNFTLNDSVYNFWMCNSSTVYFDSDLNSSADTGLNAGQSFNLAKNPNNFTLVYVNYPSEISVLFGPNYLFKDFVIAWNAPGQACPQGNAWGQFYTDQVAPVDGNMNRVLINASFSSNPGLSVVILNGTQSKTVWLADFTNNPNFANGCTSNAAAGDDNTLLLASLLMWASNKQQYQTSTAAVQRGFLIPYVNVQNSDMYEVYQFNLGLKSPFSS